MMIPVAVSKVFDFYQRSEKLQLTEDNQPVLVPREEISASKIIRLVLMNDELGKVQVMVPSDCLLDVDRLDKALGRSLQALPNEDVSNLIERYQLNSLPAIPDITGLPAYVDERIYDNNEMYVESDDPSQLIKLNKEVFELTTEKARRLSFAVPIEQLASKLVKTSDDVAQINQAIEKFTSLRIKQRLEDTLELPPLPQSAQDIIKLRSDPDAGADELADIIERDPSLSAQVVSWASSSFYNAPGKIKSVHDAIVRVLGYDMVMNLAMGLALGRTLNVPKEEPKGYTPYWHQAMWMALGTTSLISRIEPAYRPGFGLSYLSGLLHNFGYLVLAHIFPPHFALICRYIEANPHLDSAYIEHHLLGITREQVGSQLMSVWNMPTEVITALRHQKNSNFDAANSEYANLLLVTHSLLAKGGVLPGPAPEISDELLEHLHLPREEAALAIAQLLESRDEVVSVANLMGR